MSERLSDLLRFLVPYDSSFESNPKSLFGSSWESLVYSIVERIEYFCDPNPVQYFRCVIQSDPNQVPLSKYFIQFISEKNSD